MTNGHHRIYTTLTDATQAKLRDLVARLDDANELVAAAHVQMALDVLERARLDPDVAVRPDEEC